MWTYCFTKSTNYLVTDANVLCWLFKHFFKFQNVFIYWFNLYYFIACEVFISHISVLQIFKYKVDYDLIYLSFTDPSHTQRVIWYVEFYFTCKCIKGSINPLFLLHKQIITRSTTLKSLLLLKFADNGNVKMSNDTASTYLIHAIKYKYVLWDCVVIYFLNFINVLNVLYHI